MIIEQIDDAAEMLHMSVSYMKNAPYFYGKLLINIELDFYHTLNVRFKPDI